ncbi:hypothetical protein TNCV_506781 [Trichonephila clavipes]|nr:hypothetical protein TNCV_506781 [Trichonephila clavipes]
MSPAAVDVGDADYHHRHHLPHPVAPHWLTNVLIETFLSTVLLYVYATLGSEVLEVIFRSGGQSEAKPTVLSSQAMLVLIYRPIEGMEG